MDQLRALEEWELRWGVRNPSQTQWRAQAALAQMALGAHDEACRLADEDLLRASAFGAPRALGVALRVAGIVEGDAGLERLTEAVDVLAGSEARLEHAWALFELGSAVRRAGRRADAREPLRAALDLADRCGATNLADRTREELHAAGARPRRERLSGVEALTPQERRVAQMAAGGMTNRAIAQSLFLTTRTIEMHLAQRLPQARRLGSHRACQEPWASPRRARLITRMSPAGATRAHLACVHAVPLAAHLGETLGPLLGTIAGYDPRAATGDDGVRFSWSGFRDRPPAAMDPRCERGWPSQSEVR